MGIENGKPPEARRGGLKGFLGRITHSAPQPTNTTEPIIPNPDQTQPKTILEALAVLPEAIPSVAGGISPDDTTTPVEVVPIKTGEGDPNFVRAGLAAVVRLADKEVVQPYLDRIAALPVDNQERMKLITILATQVGQERFQLYPEFANKILSGRPIQDLRVDAVLTGGKVTPIDTGTKYMLDGKGNAQSPDGNTFRSVFVKSGTIPLDPNVTLNAQLAGPSVAQYLDAQLGSRQSKEWQPFFNANNVPGLPDDPRFYRTVDPRLYLSVPVASLPEVGPEVLETFVQNNQHRVLNRQPGDPWVIDLSRPDRPEEIYKDSSQTLKDQHAVQKANYQTAIGVTTSARLEIPVDESANPLLDRAKIVMNLPWTVGALVDRAGQSLLQ